MKDVKEIIEELNELNIMQTSTDLEDIPEEIYNKYFENSERVAYDIDIDKHRWYETSISVYALKKGGLIGVREVTQVYSESSTIEDIFFTLQFYSMKEKKTTTYEIDK